MHPEYNPDVVTKLMEIQSKNQAKNAFCVFDDCIDAAQFKCPKLKQLCTQLRHYRITVIFATQYANLLPSWMRTNAMGVVIFRTDSESNLMALRKEYGQLFDSFNEFKNYIIKNLGNYRFVYYDKRHVNENVEDTYKIMVAPEKIPKFHFKIKNNI